MTEKVIEVKNLTKQFKLGTLSTGAFLSDIMEKFQKNIPVSEKKVLTALDNVSFDVSVGDIVGLIGGNGAGKSTLLKVLSRITAPTAGSAIVRGRVSSLLEVGTGFHPELTGRENIFLNGTILGMSKAEVAAKLDQIVEFSGVSRFIDTPVKRFSSGMIVRLGFAVAAFLEPDILIIDEVLAVGDADFQEKCIARVGEIAKNGKAVLFVSHNMKSVKRLCNRGILLESGKIKYNGTPDEVINSYLNETNSLIIDGVVPETLERKFASREVLITEIALLNQENEKVSQLLFRQQIRFKVSVKKFIDVKEVYLAIVIKNSSMEKVVHCDVDITSQVNEFENPSFIVNVNTLLIPGKYSVNCSLLNKNKNCFDDLEDCCKFEVSLHPIEGKSLYIGPLDEGYSYTEASLKML